jgi:hypothetical protein
MSLRDSLPTKVTYTERNTALIFKCLPLNTEYHVTDPVTRCYIAIIVKPIPFLAVQELTMFHYRCYIDEI